MEVLCYTNSVAETQDKWMIFHTPGTYLVQWPVMLKDQQLAYPHLTLEEVTVFQAKAEIIPKDICLLIPQSPPTAHHVNIWQTSAFMVTVL